MYFPDKFGKMAEIHVRIPNNSGGSAKRVSKTGFSGNSSKVVWYSNVDLTDFEKSVQNVQKSDFDRFQSMPKLSWISDVSGISCQNAGGISGQNSLLWRKGK